MKARVQSEPPLDVFLSVGTPHLQAQGEFLDRLERRLRRRGFRPLSLGRNNYDNRNPLRAIRELMLGCRGAIIVGFERRFAPTALERRGSPDQRRLKNVTISTPWNHLEAGMAFQLDLPLLILKDREIHPEGILDQAVGEYLVFEFDLSVEAVRLSEPLKKTDPPWVRWRLC